MNPLPPLPVSCTFISSLAFQLLPLCLFLPALLSYLLSVWFPFFLFFLRSLTCWFLPPPPNCPTWPLSRQFHQRFHPSGKKCNEGGKKKPINKSITLSVLSPRAEITLPAVGGWGQMEPGASIHKTWCASDLWARGVGCCEPGLLLWTRSISGCPFISSAQRHKMESPPPLYREPCR